MRSSLERRLVLGVVTLFAVPTVGAGLVLFLLHRRGLLEDNPTAVALTVSIGFITMMGYLAFVAHGIGRSLVRQLQEIQLGAELMATVNPAHRLQVQTGDELESLAEQVNRLADCLRESRTGLEAEVERATREGALERGKLAAVLDALGDGVAVAGEQGRVILANRAVHDLLGAPPGGLLGRSLFDFVDRQKVAHFLDRLRMRPGSAERFSLVVSEGAILEAVMTPFAEGAGTLVGFVLVLKDVSRAARGDAARQEHLTATLRDLRGPLASIRSLAESLLAEPGGGASRRPLETIHEEALRLSEIVGGAGRTDRLAGVPRHFEEIAAPDLIAMALGRLDPGLGAAVRVEGDTEALPPFRVEASALSGVVAHLLRAVLERRDPGQVVGVRARGQGGLVQLDVGASGRDQVADLERRLDAPVALGVGAPVDARTIVHDHAGEVWAYAADGRMGFRLILPTERLPVASSAAPASRVSFIGAGTVSAATAGDEPRERPDFYDFTLVERMEARLRAADRDRRLDELHCVVLDTETTGLDPGTDRVVSLAAVRVRDGVVKRGEIFDALVNPGRAIAPASIRFHGITDEMVREAPPLEVVLPAFLRFVDDAVLVGHQVWFDLRFLGATGRRLGLAPPSDDRAVLDTLSLSEIAHGSFERHGLEEIAGRLGVAIRGRHSALGDALATADAFVRLIPLLRARAILTLGDALAAGRAGGRARR